LFTNERTTLHLNFTWFLWKIIWNYALSMQTIWLSFDNLSSPHFQSKSTIKIN
jgi:hypothetical protein